MTALSVLKFAWKSTYIILFPCVLAHIGIILALTCRANQREPTNYLVVNLSFGAILEQIGLGLVILDNEYHVTLWNNSVLCGLRAIFVRIGAPIISFTLTLLVVQGSYFTRHPESNASSKYKFSPLTILLILLVSIILYLPIQFMRTYDPNQQKPFKCIKVILLDSVLLDSIYRGIRFILEPGIPAFILLREVRRLMYAYKTYGLHRLEEQRQAELSILARIQLEKYAQLMYLHCSICLFLSSVCTARCCIFSCYSVLKPSQTLHI